MQLTIDEAQARTIIRALDFYSRVGCGQFSEVSRLFQFDPRSPRYFNHSVIDRKLDEIKVQLLPLGRGISYSIGLSCVPNNYRMAYDILQVIRHHLAWTRNPEGGVTVDFHEPLKTGDGPLCQIST